MVINIIVTYSLILLLNYAFVYSMNYIIFRSLNGKDSDSFFEKVLGVNTSEFYNMMQLYVLIPFLGGFVSGLFLYLYCKNRYAGHSDFYAVYLALKREN